MTQYFSWSRATWTTRSTHSWMVPPQSLLPDGQGVVQQVGRLLVFILIPARTHKANALSQNGREKRVQAHCLVWRAANVDFLGQFPQLMRHQLTSVSNLTVIVPPPLHTQWMDNRADEICGSCVWETTKEEEETESVAFLGKILLFVLFSPAKW